MKHLLTRVASMILIIAMCISMAACGGSGSNADNSSGSNAGSTAQADDKKESVELTLWHSFSAGVSQGVIDKFIEKYEKENPNITIKQETAQIEEYQFRKLKVAITNNSEGDVFLSYGGGYSKPFVDAGAVLPLDEYLEADKTYDRLQDGVLEYFTYGGKVYGLPLKKWAGVLFCNTELFQKCNVQYPETWDQLMSAVKTFRENGMTPMALGAKDGWHIGMYQNALAVRTAGADYCNKAIVGEATLNTPEIVRSAQLLKDLVDAKAFVDGTLGVSADEAQMEFFMGKVPMYFSGSWTSADVENPDNLVKGKIKPIPLPTVDGGKGDATQFSGGAIDCYMVNSKTKHPEEAVKLAIALTEYQSNEAYKLGDGVTAWKADFDESELNPVLCEINKLTQNATGYVIAWDTFLQGTAIDAHYKLLQDLVGGTITPEEFAEKMQKANEEALSANK